MRINEGRTVGLFTKVSPEEKEVIDQKMALLGTTMICCGDYLPEEPDDLLIDESDLPF